MRRCFVVLTLAVTTLSQFVVAAEPSPADAPERDLAHLFLPPTVTFLFANQGMIQRDLTDMMLNSIGNGHGPPCDATVEACRIAAANIAKTFAPMLQAERRAFIERLYSRFFADEMTKDEEHKTLTFLTTPAGKAYIRAMQKVTNPAEFLWALDTFKKPVGEGVSTKALDAFYEATKGLPRKTLPIVPPPPGWAQGTK